jgi:FAD:protein FMN transferase
VPAATVAASQLRFRAMGCDVHLLVVGGPQHLLAVARERLQELERRWSRFQAGSEISRLNALAGLPVHLSPVTLGLVERALEGARVSGGRYDPTVLGDVLRAGYDRSFERLTAAAPHGSSPLGRGYERIAVDHAGSAVTLPPGVGIDPGGIGKGYAADLLVEELLAQGAVGACVNVGGDLRVDGSAPGAGSWVVAIGHPLQPEPAATVTLERGAVATTSRVRRAWGRPRTAATT